MDPAIKKELAALRDEIAALRSETRAGPAPSASPPAEGASPDFSGEPKAWADDLKELVAAMQGAVEAAGKDVAVHPVMGVAAAFAAGVLIGRLTKIG